jgi:hypothetical protein
MPARANDLPKEIRDSLRMIAKYAENEELAEKDPTKFLSMLLNSMEYEMSFGHYSTSIHYLLKEYCSPFGMSIHSDTVHKKRAA